MCKKIFFILLLIILSINAAQAQRKGAVDTGGMFSFKSFSGADTSGSELDVQWIFGYYLSKKISTEIEPILRMNFQNEDVRISSIFLGGISYRLFDIVPDDYLRRRSQRRDLGTTPGIYGSAKVGLWVDGFSQKDQEKGKTYSGPALSLGLGTHSGLSKTSMLRVNAQMIYLLPNGPIFDEPRTIFQIGVGLTVFIVI
ncbi:hypothetical protein JXQ31_09795 [candidate division KSB1 bacterium]|nr:hypothetical protein [candidate division KSB1 bacterium]